MTYDLSHITEVAESGWNGDMYLSSEDAAKLGVSIPVFFKGEPLHTALTTLVATWQRTETDDGGVITYTKGGE